jgi:hypothetical protein
MSHNTQQDVERYLNELKSRGLTWREIASLPGLYGIPFGTLERYAKGREVRDPVHRRMFDMEDLTETCGQCWRVTEGKINQAKRSRPKRIQDYPVDMLRAALKFREDV